MSNIPNHDAFAVPMPAEYVPVIDEYEREAEALVQRILVDERLGKSGDDADTPFNTRISALNAIMARMMTRGAIKMFERVEEVLPLKDSREQLAIAFSTEFSDVEQRTGYLARYYADHGKMAPGIIAAQDALEKESATVH